MNSWWEGAAFVSLTVSLAYRHSGVEVFTYWIIICKKIKITNYHLSEPVLVFCLHRNIYNDFSRSQQYHHFRGGEATAQSSKLISQVHWSRRKGGRRACAGRRQKERWGQADPGVSPRGVRWVCNRSRTWSVCPPPHPTERERVFVYVCVLQANAFRTN